MCLQRAYHPDKCCNGDCSKIEKVNKAYETLNNDIERANYLINFK